MSDNTSDNTEVTITTDGEATQQQEVEVMTTKLKQAEEKIQVIKNCLVNNIVSVEG